MTSFSDRAEITVVPIAGRVLWEKYRETYRIYERSPAIIPRLAAARARSFRVNEFLSRPVSGEKCTENSYASTDLRDTREMRRGSRDGARNGGGPVLCARANNAEMHHRREQNNPSSSV